MSKFASLFFGNPLYDKTRKLPLYISIGHGKSLGFRVSGFRFRVSQAPALRFHWTRQETPHAFACWV
jgi:hypothetical protein